MIHAEIGIRTSLYIMMLFNLFIYLFDMCNV